jgi:thiamine kinase-like enzyme
VPIHGDMTPWNIFVSKEEKLILVDYERAGWHVPFYDVFHYILQPWALRPHTPDLAALIFKKDWYEKGWLNEALILYLIDQLYNDMTDFNIKKYRHKHLQQAIENKKAWLNEAFDAAAFS